MTVKTNCGCELVLCPHPRFFPDDPTCKNWPEAGDTLCKECRERRQKVQMETAKAERK